MMIKRLFISILLSLSVMMSNAQAFQFVKSGIDPVSSAMGGVSSVYVKPAYSAFNNLAVCSFSEYLMDVAVGYYDMQPNGTRVRGFNVGGYYCIADVLGVSVAFSGGKGLAYDQFDMNGNPCGNFTPSEYMVSVGTAYKLGSFLSFGLNAGYARAGMAPENSYSALVSDFFIMSEFSGVRFTLGISDLGTSIKSISGDSYSLPTTLVAGAGYTMHLGEGHTVRVATESNLWKECKVSTSVGASYMFADLVEIRAGYRYGGSTVIPSYCSAGIGVDVFGLCLDFSYVLPVIHNRLSGSWNIGLSFTIGRAE